MIYFGLFFFFWDKVSRSRCVVDWPWISHPPDSACQVLELQVCLTRSHEGFTAWFWWAWLETENLAGNALVDLCEPRRMAITSPRHHTQVLPQDSRNPFWPLLWFASGMSSQCLWSPAGHYREVVKPLRVGPSGRKWGHWGHGLKGDLGLQSFPVSLFASWSPWGEDFLPHAPPVWFAASLHPKGNGDR